MNARGERRLGRGRGGEVGGGGGGGAEMWKAAERVEGGGGCMEREEGTQIVMGTECSYQRIAP